MNISPDFSTPGLALSIPLVAYVLAEGVIGKRTHERMERRRAQDPKALTGMFRTWIACAWGSAAVALGVLAVSPGAALSDLGLRLPDDLSRTFGIIAGAAIGMTAMALIVRRYGPAVQQDAVTSMHPRTAAERGWAAAMSVTAGICEEIVYRGFLIALGVGVLGLDVKPAALLALALFVLGHLYQGRQGMLLVGLTGGGLTYLYLSTGSLVLPIVVHAVIDIMALVVIPALAPRRTVQAAS